MRGMLFSQMEPPPALESDFNDWYETEHIPVRLALPGFARAVRYRQVNAVRRYLAVYEIDDLRVLDTPGYQVLKTQPSERTARMLSSVDGFTRFTCNETYDSGTPAGRGRYLSAVAYAVPAERRDAFERWYASEVPRLMSLAGSVRVRRYEVFSGDGGPWTHFALHELAVVPPGAALTAYADAEALAGETWFAQPGQWLFEVISVHEAKASS